MNQLLSRPQSSGPQSHPSHPAPPVPPLVLPQPERPTGLRSSTVPRTLAQTVQALIRQRFIRVSALCALFVWSVWLTALGPAALVNMGHHWQIAVTMIFGSMVAGGTSMGGGAIAFPVMTKVLQVAPHDAMLFSLAIQSIGMTAAALVIVAMGTPLEWRFIRWASLGGLLGMAVGTNWLVNILPPTVIRLFFSMLLASFTVVLLLLTRRQPMRRTQQLIWNPQARTLAVIVGSVGGLLSGVMGSGMDIFCYSILVLVFGLCETISTPTSVMLMAINAVSGFAMHLGSGTFTAPVSHYWLAAVPVVVVGAPLGAMICRQLRRQAIIKIVMGLSALELLSSVALIPLNASLVAFAVLAFVLLCAAYLWLYRTFAFLRP